MSDANLKIVIDALNLASGELKQVQAQLNGVEQSGRQSAGGLGAAGDAFEQLTGVSLTGAGALMAVGGALKYSIDQAAEAEQIMAQTEAAIRSTGGAAGLTAQEVADMAAAFSASTTFADDAIQKGQNLLLTFTNIGADVFPQATQAMLDMATAMGTDASSGAIQLGKALNDPKEGVSALTRVGVVFTESQKQLINSLQAAGDMAGAQQVILAELNKEFGGSAAAQVGTYAGSMLRLKNSFDNVAEAIGGSLLPPLAEAANALDILIGWQQRVDAAERQATEAITDNAATWEDWVRQTTVVKDAAGDLTPAARDMFLAYADGTRTLTEAGSAIEDMTGEVLGMTRAQWEATHAAQMQADAWAAGEASLQRFVPAMQGSGKSLEQVWQDLEDAAADSADKQAQHVKDLETSLDNLRTILAGPLKSEQESYYERQKSAGAAIVETQGQIDGLNAKSYLTPTQSQQLDDLKSKLADQKQVYADNAAAHEEATARIIFGLLEQKVVADGVQDGDISFLAEMGRAWGLYDEQTAAAMEAVDTAITEHGTNAMAVLTDLENKALGLPNIDRYIQYHLSTTGRLPSAAAGDLGLADAPVVIRPETETEIDGMRAAGGPVRPWGTYLVGEDGPELFRPRQAGEIIPADETARLLADPRADNGPAALRVSSGAPGLAIPPSPRAGGELQTSATDAPRYGPVNITVNVSGVSDPRLAADLVVQRLEDRGLLPQSLTR